MVCGKAEYAQAKYAQADWAYAGPAAQNKDLPL